MMMRSLVTLGKLWFTLRLAEVLCTLCPVSKHYDATQHFHRYPISVYYPNLKPQFLTAYNCNTHVMTDRSEFRNDFTLCDRNVSLCPVNEENVRSAMSVASWPQYVDAMNNLGRASAINVFYLGGSMTAGGETMCRCRCMNTEDSRCAPFSLPSHLNSSYCSWPSHLTRWLNHTYPATKFNIHDYTLGGADSRSSAYFIHKVHTSTANLSNPALFFLDYSVNDAVDNSATALETFIYTIYNNFGRHYNIRPTMVLLEQYPLGVFNQPKSTEQDYALSYRRIAKRYSLVLISLREVYWTYFGPPQGRNLTNPDTTHRYYPISPLDPNVHTVLHPPWYIHLFIADVIAECMKRIAVHFQGNSNSDFNMIHNLHNRTHAPTMSYVPPGPLPAPLYNHTTELQQVCNIAVPFRISATARPIEIPVHQIDWHKGWIEHVSHNTPGWEINRHSNHTARALSFYLNGSAAELKGNSVMITYLKSYEGMGSATVHACGAAVSNAPVIEGLWTFPGSFPWPLTFVLQDIDIARCQLLPRRQRFLSIVYAPGADQEEVRAKHNHLFKVFNVQVCTPILSPAPL